jgi:hypothetical protein
VRPRVTRRLYAVYRRGADQRPSVATVLDLLRTTAAAVARTTAHGSTPST